MVLSLVLISEPFWATSSDRTNSGGASGCEQLAQDVSSLSWRGVLQHEHTGVRQSLIPLGTWGRVPHDVTIL